MSEAVHKFLRHCDQARFIFESTASWEAKYTQIFALWSGDIKGDLALLNDSLDWYDPDTTYEADVKAFIEVLAVKVAGYAEAYVAANPDVRYCVTIEREGKAVARITLRGHGDQAVSEVTALVDNPDDQRKDIRFINAVAEAVHLYEGR